jgi:hypothetical protein
VRLDRINSFSPIHALRYYFVRHSTGLSYAYLLAALLVFGTYIALVIGRYLDAGEQSEATFRVSFEEEQTLLAESVSDPLHPQTGFRYRFANDTLNEADPLDLSSVVTYSYTRCTRTFVAGSTDPHTDSCDGDLGAATSAYGDGLYVVPAETAELDQSPQSSKPVQFVRFTLSRCATGCNLTSAEIDALLAGGSLEFAGFTHAPTQPAELDDDVLGIALRTFDFYEVPNLRHAGEMEYRRVSVVRHARFLVDGEDSHFAELHGPRVGLAPSGATEPLYQIDFVLTDERTEVHVLTTGWIDLVAQIAGLLLVLRVLGIVPWLWNRSHFYRHGHFEAAEMPRKYLDRVLDPKVKEPVAGRREVRALRREHKFTETEFKLRETMKHLVGVREALRPLIEKVLHEELEREERA